METTLVIQVGNLSGLDPRAGSRGCKKNMIKVLLYIKRRVKRMCSWMGLRSEQGCCFAQSRGWGWEGASHREYRVKGVIWNLQSRAFDVIKVRTQGI